MAKPKAQRVRKAASKPVGKQSVEAKVYPTSESIKKYPACREFTKDMILGGDIAFLRKVVKTVWGREPHKELGADAIRSTLLREFYGSPSPAAPPGVGGTAGKAASAKTDTRTASGATASKPAEPAAKPLPPPAPVVRKEGIPLHGAVVNYDPNVTPGVHTLLFGYEVDFFSEAIITVATESLFSQFFGVFLRNVKAKRPDKALQKEIDGIAKGFNVAELRNAFNARLEQFRAPDVLKAFLPGKFVEHAK